MRQYAKAEFCGIVGHITRDLPNNKLTIMLLVNQADSYNLHLSNTKYFVTFFNGACKSIIGPINKGDTLILKDVDMVINYDEKKIFFNVQKPEQCHLIAVENRKTLLARIEQDKPDLGLFKI